MTSEPIYQLSSFSYMCLILLLFVDSYFSQGNFGSCLVVVNYVHRSLARISADRNTLLFPIEFSSAGIWMGVYSLQNRRDFFAYFNRNMLKITPVLQVRRLNQFSRSKFIWVALIRIRFVSCEVRRLYHQTQASLIKERLHFRSGQRCFDVRMRQDSICPWTVLAAFTAIAFIVSIALHGSTSSSIPLLLIQCDECLSPLPGGSLLLSLPGFASHGSVLYL